MNIYIALIILGIVSQACGIYGFLYSHRLKEIHVERIYTTSIVGKDGLISQTFQSDFEPTVLYEIIKEAK